MTNTSISEHDSVLITGSTLSGRRRLFHQTLAELAPTPVVVLTRQTADRARESHVRMVTADSGGSAASEIDSPGSAGTDPVVVDCVSNALGRSKEDTSTTKHAQHPSNLTSIGTKFTEVVDEWDAKDCVVGIETISPLLVYADPKAVFQFVHLIIQQAQGVGWPVVATIDSAAHDDIEVERFVPLFDCLLETRCTEHDGQEFRVRQPEQREWQSIQQWRSRID